jgi:hypothetical protein
VRQGSSEPRTKVSWQVTGVRKDAYAHRISVETMKRPAERGSYLHPELYGQPASHRLTPVKGLSAVMARR